MPVLKVGLGEAQFGLEPVTFAQIWKGFLYSSTNACSACLNLPRPVSSQLVTTDTLQVAPQVLILIFGREQVSFADVINCDDLSKLLLLHTLFQTPICCISMRIVSKHQHLVPMMLRCMIVKVELVDCIEMGKTGCCGNTRLVSHVPAWKALLLLYLLLYQHLLSIANALCCFAACDSRSVRQVKGGSDATRRGVSALRHPRHPEAALPGAPIHVPHRCWLLGWALHGGSQRAAGWQVQAW